ncbi:MAG: hypothetical protein ACTSQO_08960 [Candidatus Helarchaeota archaeon]
MKKLRIKLLNFIVLIILMNSLFVKFVNATPNYGTPIDRITSVLWEYNSHNSKNIIQLQNYDKPNIYFFSVIGNQNNSTNNVTLLLKDGTIYWNNFSVSSSITSIKVSDIDNDVEPEIIVGTLQNGLFIFKTTGFGVPEYIVPINNITAIGINNLSKDAGKEIVIFNEDKISVYLNNGTLLWNYDLPLNETVDENCYIIHDINSDNVKDVIYGAGNYLVALNGKNQTQFWNKTLSSKIYSLEIGDIDNNGINDIILGMDKNLTLINSINGDIIWSTNGTNQMAVSGSVKNIILQDTNKDFGTEIVCSSINKSGGIWPVIYKFNSSGNLIQFAIVKNGNGNITNIVLGDINGDGQKEFVSSDTFGQVIAWTLNLRVIWNYTYSSPIYSMVMGFINFDNIPDILISSIDGFVLAIGVPTGSINLILFYSAIGIGVGIFVGSVILVFFGIRKLMHDNKKRN